MFKLRNIFLVVICAGLVAGIAVQASGDRYSLMPLDRVYQLVEGLLRNSDVVIRGEIICIGLPPRTSSLPSRFRSAGVVEIHITVEEVIGGWYWADDIVILMDARFNPLPCKVGDKAIVCANFHEESRRFVMQRDGLFIEEKRRWWNQSRYSWAPVTYKTAEIRKIVASN